jgi:hypothetical protein
MRLSLYLYLFLHQVSARQEGHSQDHQAENKRLEDDSENHEDEKKYKEPTPPRSNTSTAGAHGDKDSINIWAVNVRLLFLSFILAC